MGVSTENSRYGNFGWLQYFPYIVRKSKNNDFLCSKFWLCACPSPKNKSDWEHTFDFHLLKEM